MARPISIRWISLVPSKIVKIFAQRQRHRYTRVGPPIALRMGVLMPIPVPRTDFPAPQVTARYACWRRELQPHMHGWSTYGPYR